MPILNSKSGLNGRIDRQQRILRDVSTIIIGIIFVFAILTAYFIYINIERAYSDSYLIIAIIPTTEMDVIDVASFEKNEQQLKNKLQPYTVPANIRNIFTYLSVAAPTTTISSTPI